MVYLKKLGISILYIFSSLIFLTLIMTLFNYFNILSDKSIAIFKIIIPIISFIMGGFYKGKNSNKRGLLEGVKVGIISTIILFIFCISTNNYLFKLKYLFFYLILIFSCSLGSMIGINKKKK